MQFLYKPGSPIKGHLSYIDQDKAIDFEPENEKYRPGHRSPSAALVVGGTLQIEFLIDSGCLLCVWGYLPRESWQHESSQLSLEAALPGMVFVSGVDDVVKGSAYRTNLDSAPVHYYQKSGHLLIGELEKADVLVEIATDTVIGLKDGQLRCVVLKPIIS